MFTWSFPQFISSVALSGLSAGINSCHSIPQKISNTYCYIFICIALNEMNFVALSRASLSDRLSAPVYRESTSLSTMSALGHFIQWSAVDPGHKKSTAFSPPLKSRATNRSIVHIACFQMVTVCFPVPLQFRSFDCQLFLWFHCSAHLTCRRVSSHCCLLNLS